MAENAEGAIGADWTIRAEGAIWGLRELWRLRRSKKAMGLGSYWV